MVKKILKLEKQQSIYLKDNEIYIILSGKIIARDIFFNGKTIKYEIPLSKGDVIGNFFKICKIYENITKGLEIEIEAIEQTILNVVDIKEFAENLKDDTFWILKNLVNQMLKKYLITIYHHAYSKKGYVLVVLLLHSNKNGYISKELLNHKIFNLSRSRFFSIMNELKNECLIIKNSEGTKIDIEKVKKYLELEN